MSMVIGVRHGGPRCGVRHGGDRLRGWFLQVGVLSGSGAGSISLETRDGMAKGAMGISTFMTRDHLQEPHQAHHWCFTRRKRRRRQNQQSPRIMDHTSPIAGVARRPTSLLFRRGTEDQSTTRFEPTEPSDVEPSGFGRPLV